MEEQPFSGVLPEKDIPFSPIWEETKRRLQGAFQVLTGKSAFVHLPRLRALEFSHAIVQDDVAYSRGRDLEKGIAPER